MMSHFIMDLKAEHNATTKLLNQYNGYNLSPNSNSNGYSNEQTTNGVLDLSRRRDSVETRKTPSPYSPSTFSEDSPSTHHGSPSISTTTSNMAETTKIHFPIKHTSPIMLHHHHQHLQQQQHQQQINNLHNLQNMRQYHGNSPVSPVYPVFPDFPLQQFNHHAYSNDNDTTTVAATSAAAVLTANLYRSSPPIQSNNSNNEINHQFVLKTEDNNDADNDPELVKRLKDRKSDLSDVDSDNESISVASTGTSSVGNNSNNASSAKKYPMIVGRDGKLSRPFKAYPRDPMTLAASFTATDTLLDSHSAEKYNTFRKRMLEQIHAANGGTPTVSNPKMRRTAQQKFSDDFTAEKTLSKFEKLTNLNGHSATNNNNNNNNNNNAQETNSNNNLPSNINNNNNNNSNDILINDNNNTIKDSAYFERRKKNNAAAKKSRDRRRIKEDEIAIRAAFLERENIELKFELAAARKQLQIYGVTTTTAATT